MISASAQAEEVRKLRPSPVAPPAPSATGSGAAASAKPARIEAQKVAAVAADKVADPLMGGWTIRDLEGGKGGSLKIEQVSRGLVGAAASGAVVMAEGKACPFQAMIVDRISGMYPDGARIMSTDLAGLMKLTAQCEGASLSIDGFVAVDAAGAIKIAGRSLLSRSGASPETTLIAIAR